MKVKIESYNYPVKFDGKILASSICLYDTTFFEFTDKTIQTLVNMKQPFELENNKSTPKLRNTEDHYIQKLSELWHSLTGKELTEVKYTGVILEDGNKDFCLLINETSKKKHYINRNIFKELYSKKILVDNDLNLSPIVFVKENSVDIYTAVCMPVNFEKYNNSKYSVDININEGN